MHQQLSDWTSTESHLAGTPLCGSLPCQTKVTPLLRPKRSTPLLSPLRYPGGKRRLVAYIAEALKLNDLHPALFVEPFAGGASVALQLLADGAVDRVGLIDKDPLVAAFWNTVVNDVDWLTEQIEAIDVTVQQWKSYKAAVPSTTRERALACLFLNRTSFSGILAPSAGPIGGYAQASEYAIDCRFPRSKLVKRIRQVHALRDRIAFVWNLSWGVGISRIHQMQRVGILPDDVAYYCDPPFFEEAQRLYTYYFRRKDHLRLRDALLNMASPWILSYDSVRQVEELYGSDQRSPSHVELLYSAGKGAGNRVVREAIVSNLRELPSGLALWAKSARSGTKRTSISISA